MIDLQALQKSIYENKVAKGFNTTDIHKEFCYIYEEVAEANRAYYRKEGNVGEELADVAIFLMGLSEMLGINLEDAIVRKVEKNKNRQYTTVDGVNIRIGD